MKIIKNNWKIKLLSIFLAIFFWSFVIISENPVVSTRISNVKIVYENKDKLEEKGLVISEELKNNIDVNITGQRNNVINVNPQHIRVSLDLSNLREGSHLLKVNYNLPNGVKLNEAPYMVNVKVEKVLSRNFDVVIKNEGKINDSYVLESKKATPTKITIKGARSKLDQIKNVVVSLSLTNLEDNSTLNLPVKALNDENEKVKDVVYGQDFVNIIVNVLKQKEVEIKPNIIGEIKNGNRLSKHNLSKTKTYIKGPKEIIDKINFITTKAIDISDIKESTIIPVKLSLPSDVELVNKDIDYTLNVEISKRTEKKFNIEKKDIKILSSSTQSAVLNSNSISVTVVGFEEDLEKIKKENIKAILDVRDMDEGTYYLKPNISIDNKNVKEEDIKSISNLVVTINRN